MPYDLREISGITFLRGNPDTLYAEEDEDGKVFYFHPGDGKFAYRKFGKRGDFEDITVLDNKEFVLLRSDGSLFTFPVEGIWGEPAGGGKHSSERDDGSSSGSGNGKEKVGGEVRSYGNILPTGEYEGLFGDDNGRLIALCKNCPDDDQHREVSGYVLGYDARHNLAIRQHFKIDVSGVKLTSINRKIKFHPSCLARNPLTRQWYLISSVNKILLILDDNWKVTGSYPLSPSLFKQPEGLAFDRDGNMYISNEGQGGNGNVLLFKYKR